MIQVDGANVHILAKEIYDDQRELISMLKATYADYWKTKEDGQPRESQSEGNFWKIDHRVCRMADGRPLLEKEVFYKKKDGSQVRIRDEVRNSETSLEGGLERQRESIDRVAFLTTAYEAHERYEGDVARIDEAVGDIDVFNQSRAGIWTRENLRDDYPDIPNDGVNYEVVNWQFVSTDVETWSSSKAELLVARKNNRELPLPPSDGGYPRTEKDYYVGIKEGNTGNTNPLITFG